MATPTYNPVRRMDNDTALPKNSKSKKQLRTFHLDDNLAMLAVLLERFITAVFSVGGTVLNGTVTQTVDEVQVQARLAITKDAKQLLYVEDETIDFNGQADGYYLLTIVPTVKTVSRSFVDAETGQTLVHAMISDLGVLATQFDAGSYPTLDDNAAAVAQVQVASGSISSFTLVNTAPTARY